MKKALLGILCLILMLAVFTVSASAGIVASGTVGNIEWSFNGYTLNLSGNGSIPDYDTENLPPWYTFNEKIKLIEIENVTSIGAYAFADSNAYLAILPDTVTEVSGDAFIGCSSLDYIMFAGADTVIGDGLIDSSVLVYGSKNTTAYDYAVANGNPFCENDVYLRGECGESSYFEYDIASSALTISGTGEMADDPFAAVLGYLEFKWGETVALAQTVTINDEITALGDNTFTGFAQLATIYFDGAAPAKLDESGLFGDLSAEHAVDMYVFEGSGLENAGDGIDYLNVCAAPVGEAFGHVYSDSWTIDEAPTCLASGIKSHHCVRCDIAGEPVTAAALGHSYTTYYRDNNASCCSNGTESSVCDNGCGTTIFRYIEGTMRPHVYDDGVVTTAPTCTETGVLTKTCKTCTDTKVYDIPALGHNYIGWRISVPVTCTTAGEETRTCTICSDVETRIIPARGHSFGEEVIVKPATVYETGESERPCTNPGCNYAIHSIIPQLVNVGAASENEPEETGFMASIRAFFKKIADFFSSLFG